MGRMHHLIAATWDLPLLLGWKPLNIPAMVIDVLEHFLLIAHRRVVVRVISPIPINRSRSPIVIGFGVIPIDRGGIRRVSVNRRRWVSITIAIGWRGRIAVISGATRDQNKDHQEKRFHDH